MELSELEILRIFQIRNFWNIQNCKFLEFSKFTIFLILQIRNFWNFLNWKFFEFSNVKFFEFSKLQIIVKIFQNFGTFQIGNNKKIRTVKKYLEIIILINKKNF